MPNDKNENIFSMPKIPGGFFSMKAKPLFPINPKGLDDVARDLLVDAPEPETPPAGTGTPPAPAKDIANPENYIVLPGKRHINYAYSNLLVSKEVYHKGKNWRQCQEELSNEDSFMLTIRQFADFLKLLRNGDVNVRDGNNKIVKKDECKAIYNEITAVKDPYRAEWLDADFKVINGQLNINYEHKIVNRVITPGRTEILESCLMEDKKPGINLEGWLNTANKQGLPLRTTTKGDLYYWFPRSDNNSVARFWAGSVGADLGCIGDPAYTVAGLGVRRVFLKK